MVQFTVNGKTMNYDGDPDMPLLWYLREDADLKGTKFGCGIAQCGACTVHLNGQAFRSCVVPMASVEGAEIVTIEGLADGENLHPVQEAWIEEDVPQCGYCQAGQIMATADLLSRNDNPSDDDINTNITNICRCGTYYRIRKAIHRAAEIQRDRNG
ncbi:(2Fe-2S)-binding protein [Hyphococcus flavus]|uniref:(2Fe-2S)-binding protein n=1 Tax=Hyphococcus flavus TaxID=1866326 RepID=A0AAF0CDZ6_9PROT|nr:(2Fe-2S)-binding protein [Hyphococcus flavus]WDI30461.1 (2Fe-2S)-binding protein [Hyphococcus flavus]